MLAIIHKAKIIFKIKIYGLTTILLMILEELMPTILSTNVASKMILTLEVYAAKAGYPSSAPKADIIYPYACLVA